MGLDKTLLVTGAGGQLGLALAEIAPDGVHLSRDALDITDGRAVLDAVTTSKPEVIINAAAYTNVDGAEKEQDLAHEVNVHGPRHLARAANEVDALLVHVSTDYVFPGDRPAPYTEKDEPDPKSVYGRTKREGELSAQLAKRWVVVRTSWVFGEGRNFIRAILGAADKNSQLDVVSDQRGLPTYAVDLAAGIVELISAGATGLYHLAAGGEPTTWAGLAVYALEVAGKTASVREVSTDEYFSKREGPTAARPSNSVLDCSKAAGLGVRLPPWRDAVMRYVESSATATK